MAKTAKDITFGVRLDGNQFDTGLKKAEDKLDKLDKKADKSTGSVLGKVSSGVGGWAKSLGGAIANPLTGALAGAAVVGSIGAGLKSAFQAGMEDIETDNILKTHLDKIGKGADFEGLKDFAGNFVNAMNIDDTDAKAAMNQLLEAGLNPEQLKTYTTMAGDIAKTTGEDIVEVSKKLAKAANGDTRALKDYGVFLESTGDKALDAKLAMQQLQKTYGGNGAKLAAQENPMKRLSLMFSELGETIGKKLIPIITPWIASFSEFISELLDSGKIEVWIEQITNGLTTVFGWLSTAFVFWKDVFNKAFDFVIELWNSKLMPVLNYAIGFVQDIFSGLSNGNFFNTVFEMFKMYMGIAFDFISLWAGTIGNMLWTTVKKYAAQIIQWIVDKLGFMIPDSLQNSLTEGLQGAADANIIPDDIGKKFEDFNNSVAGKLTATRDKIRQQNGTTEAPQDNTFGAIQRNTATSEASQSAQEKAADASGNLYGKGSNNFATANAQQQANAKRLEEQQKAAEKRRKQLQSLQGNKTPVIRLYSPVAYKGVQSR